MDTFHEMFKELPLPALVMTREGVPVDANDAFHEIFPEDDSVSALVHELIGNAASLLQSEQKNVTFEKKVERNEDDGRLYRVRMSRVTGVEQPLVMILLTDITERRQHIEEIERLASIVECSEDAILSVSLDKKVMSWNKGAERVYRYLAGAIVDSSAMKLIPQSVAEEFEALLARAAHGQAIVRHETINTRNGGHLFPVSMSLSPLVYHGAVIGVTIVARDISLRRETEEKLAISHRQMKSLMHETVESLSTAHEKRDLYTAGHQRSVSMLSCCIADEMNLSHDQLEGIRISALLHDIGKVCIPMAILSKPAKLTREETALMRQHPVAGFEIVKNVPFPWPVKDIIVQHHERIDGSGYPNGLTGDAILPEARILAVADVLEAMSSHRPYRPALGLEAALTEVVDQAGKLYDEQVCKTAVKLFDIGVIRIEQGKLVCSL